MAITILFCYRNVDREVMFAGRHILIKYMYVGDPANAVKYVILSLRGNCRETIVLSVARLIERH